MNNTLESIVQKEENFVVVEESLNSVAISNQDSSNNSSKINVSNSNSDNNNSSSDSNKDTDNSSFSVEDLAEKLARIEERFRTVFGRGLNSSPSDSSNKTSDDDKFFERKVVLSAPTVEAVVDYVKSGNCKKIIVMTGAGISVAAGIPDFRTPGTGLYSNLQKYNLPYPTAVFEIEYFKRNPEAFFLLAKEIYPSNFTPTPVHYFIKLLHEKGLLLRNYTQNIDTLERYAGIPGDVLVEAHGSFATSHCVACKKEHSQEWVKERVFSDTVPRCTECKDGLVKPDIVFFGESLPERYFELYEKDFNECDLLLVIGTSLKVNPFASLITHVTPSTPRLLINNEVVGISANPNAAPTLYFSGSFTFSHPENARDVKLIGDCQESVKQLCELLGWSKDLQDLIDLVAQSKSEKDKPAESENKVSGNI